MRTPQNQHYQNTNNTRTTHTHTTRTTHTHTQHAPQSTTQLYTHTTRKPPLAPKHPNSYRHTHVSIHFFVPPTTSPTSNERRHLPAPSPTSRDSFDTFDTSLILDARFASCVCVCVCVCFVFASCCWLGDCLSLSPEEGGLYRPRSRWLSHGAYFALKICRRSMSQGTKESKGWRNRGKESCFVGARRWSDPKSEQRRKGTDTNRLVLAFVWLLLLVRI